MERELRSTVSTYRVWGDRETMNGTLTPAEVAHFRDHGWVIASAFLPLQMGADPATLRAHFMELHERVATPPKYMVLFSTSCSLMLLYWPLPTELEKVNIFSW